MNKQVSNQRNDYFRDACKADEVPEGSMKHVEVDGKEILIAKVDGKFYAIADRCGHITDANGYAINHLLYALSLMMVLAYSFL